MSIEELLDILKHGNLSEIDTFEASMEVESVIRQLRELNAALYEANRKNDEMTRATERLNQDCATVGHTPGPWFCGRALRGGQECVIGDDDSVVCFMPDRTIGCTFIPEDARLIAAAPLQHAEMLRFLPVLERAEADPELWARLTEGTGIATANAYRAAIAAATGETP